MKLKDFHPLMCVWQFGVVSLELSDALPFTYCQTSPWSQDVRVSCYHPSFIRMKGGTNCFPELQKMLKSYAASPVIDYSLNFTCCVKSAFQNSLLLWSYVGHRLKITEINLSDKNAGRMASHCSTGTEMQTQRQKCPHFVQISWMEYLFPICIHRDFYFLYSMIDMWGPCGQGRDCPSQRESIPGDSRQPAGVTPLTCKPSIPESIAHSLSLPAPAVCDTIRLP